MLLEVTQRLPEGRTQKALINTANVVRILPWNGGAMVKTTDGGETETAENPAWFRAYWPKGE